MKEKNNFWMAVWCFIFLVACNGEPKFINHLAPNLTVSFDGFFNDDMAFAALGCDEIRAPSNLIGGLNPSFPIAICAIRMTGEGSEGLRAEIDSGQFFYYTGGLLGNYVRYVIHQNGKFVLLKTEEDFQKLFAPIESSDEALSYVLAVRNLSAYYGLQHEPAYKYEVDTIEDTFVTSETGGYLVHLFYDQVFGCGPHWTSEIDVRVSLEGKVEEVATKPIFRNPNMDDVCVD